MGTPLTANEPGDDCIFCWGVGKRFGDTTTPRVIIVTLTNLITGDFGSSTIAAQLLVPHLLEQTIAPCVWEIETDGFLWRLNFPAGVTTLVVERISDGRRAFLDNFPPPCSLTFDNALALPANNIAFGGSASISWSLAGL